MLYDIIYMWNLKYTQNGNRPTDIKTNLRLPKGRGVGEGQSRDMRLIDTNQDT